MQALAFRTFSKLIVMVTAFVYGFAPKVEALSSSTARRSVPFAGHGQEMENVAGVLSEDIADIENMLSLQDVSSSPGVVPPAVLQLDRTEACPEGYVFVPGDVPGGDFFGRGFIHEIDSITSCSVDCDSKEACLSFEYSPTSRNCYLNKVAQPTAATIGDTVFCQRHSSLIDIQNTTGDATLVAATSQGSLGESVKTVIAELWPQMIAVAVLVIIALLLCWYCSTRAERKVPDDPDQELNEVWVRLPKA